jgi:hypothetical protein
LVRLRLAVDLLKVQNLAHSRVYEDMVAPARTPKLETQRLDQAARIAESHVGDVAA